MKALSIRQPWVFAILHAGKDVENRNWREDGVHSRQARALAGRDILLHASAGMTRAEYHEAADCIAAIAPAIAIPPFERMVRGGIVGTARIAGFLSASASPWFFGPYAIALSDARPTRFVPMKGALGFFDVPDSIVREALP